MRKLYEIEADIEDLIELDADRFVSGETGEIVSREAFDALQIEWTQKIEGVACGYKNEMAEAEAIKKEEKRLEERRKRHEKKAEGYKAFLQTVLDGRKFETSKVSITQNKSKRCDWNGNTEGLAKYLKPQEPKFDRARALADLKAGIEVPNCTLVDTTSISIN